MKRRLSVEAVVINPAGEVLLVRQGRTRQDWELPGGKVHKAESLQAGLLREVLEETRLSVGPRRLIGVFFIPIGEEIFHNFVFACDLVGERRRQPRPNPPEIAEAAFFPVNRLPEPIRPFTRDRILDATRGKVHVLPIELAERDWVG